MYRVLIVDDEKMIREGIKKSLDWENLNVDEVFTAASAKEATQVLNTNQIDLMITDISMAEVSGLELVEQIRKTNSELRIIVLTGYDRFEYARQALQLRVHDFLLKPIDEEELTASIRKQLYEFEKIRNSIKETLAQKRAEGLHQQYILEHFMRDFIEGKIKDEESLNLFYKQFHFRSNQKMKVIILIPKLFALQEMKVENNRFYTLKSICMNIIDRNNLGVTFSDRDNLIVVALFCQGDNTDQIIKMFVKKINEQIKTNPQLFIGCSIRGFQNLYISYNNAKSDIGQRFGLGEQIFQIDLKNSRLDLFQDVFQEFKNAIVASVDKKERLLHILDRFKIAVESYNLSIDYTINCYFELLTTVYYVYFKETGNVFDKQLSSFLTTVSGLDREEINQIAEKYLCKLFENNDEEEHELIRKAKKIINSNLEKDITITFIADNLCITSNYLSKLFKQITGEGCKDYIVRKRIDKAKILLETTTLNIGEVAAMTGYNDANYFSAVFKKHIGNTPSEFRRITTCNYID